MGDGGCVEVVYIDYDLALDHAEVMLERLASNRGLLEKNADITVITHPVLRAPAWRVDPATGLVI